MKKLIQVTLICTVLLLSCSITKNGFKFNLESQSLESCDKSGFIELSIKNDSINSKGFTIEKEYLIYLKNQNNIAPKTIYIDSIPSTYSINGGKIKNQDFKLKKNANYIITKMGYGSPSFQIKISTDSLGKVYYSTHTECGLNSYVIN